MLGIHFLLQRVWCLNVDFVVVVDDCLFINGPISKAFPGLSAVPATEETHNALESSNGHLLQS